MTQDLCEVIDELLRAVTRLLAAFAKSKALQGYLAGQIETFLFATLINNFFLNLTPENVKEYGLPKGNIGKIRVAFRGVMTNVRYALKSPLSGQQRIDVEYYSLFKAKLQKDYFPFFRIMREIERKVNFKKARGYIGKMRIELANTGRPPEDLSAFISTAALEAYIRKHGRFPDRKNLNKLMRAIAVDAMPLVSKRFVKALKSRSRDMLEQQRHYLAGFERRLYRRWRIPIDLSECLIRISLESVQQHAEKLRKTTDKTNDFKREALIKLHARALQVCNEILVLLKAGYPDGANSRWRTLHELAVISLFLRDTDNEVSRRYLDHDYVKRFKEAKDYMSCYRKLGYPPLGRKELNRVKRGHSRMIDNYGSDFEYRVGFEWIPKSLLGDRTFRSLANYVRMGRLHPYYSLSCNAVHGGARGFYRLGVMDQYQDKVLAVGPSNFGLADPMQNAAISLWHITSCILVMEPDFESLIAMQVAGFYASEIGAKAAEVQRQIEREEELVTKRN
ncbi:MAG: DUF5677 domain-containing protein [Thermodesulfobacteriota bacterium]